MMLVDQESAEEICRRVIGSFDTRIRALYEPADLERGNIATCNRKGELMLYPIMSVSLAVVTNKYKTFHTHLEISDIAAELKKKAKSIAGSTYIRDERQK